MIAEPNPDSVLETQYYQILRWNPFADTLAVLELMTLPSNT